MRASANGAPVHRCLLTLLSLHSLAWTMALSPMTPTARLRSSSVPPAAHDSWEIVEGCQVLRPQGQPRALIHFLGGVFVSPAPQRAYRHVLESLSRRGYIVVATPFEVEFDYNVPCADIHARFQAAKTAVVAEYGAVPQVAMGHSLGALMQVLLGCTYAEYSESCQAAALISFNNKPVSDAIPLFEQVFVPVLSPLAPLAQPAQLDEAISNVASLRTAGFETARYLGQLALNPVALLGQLGGIRIVSDAAESLDRALVDAEAIAALADQIPRIIGDISRGTCAFEPAPAEVKALIAERYSQRQPLVVSFTDDSLDESADLEAALPASASALPLRLRGTHLTPLAVDPTSPTGPLPPLPGLAEAARAALLDDAEVLIEELDSYFSRAVNEAEAAGWCVETDSGIECMVPATDEPPPEEEWVAQPAEVDLVDRAAEEAAEGSAATAVDEATSAPSAAAPSAAEPLDEMARAVAADAQAKLDLRQASEDVQRARGRARDARMSAALKGSVQPRYARLRQVAKARAAQAQALRAEAELERRASFSAISAVEARVAEIEALAAAAVDDS